MHRHGSSFKLVLDKLETYSVHRFLYKQQHQVMKSLLKEISARYTLSWMGFLGTVNYASIYTYYTSMCTKPVSSEPVRKGKKCILFFGTFGLLLAKKYGHVYPWTICDKSLQ